MKVLITGAAGFIGGHLYEKLKNDGNIIIGVDDFSHPSKNPIWRKVYKWDVRSSLYQNTPNALCLRWERGESEHVENIVEWADIVYHLAAQIHVDKSISDPKDTVDRNVLGTLNILEACRKYKKKLVFASTSEVYGTSQTEYMAESHPLDAQSPYGASKVAADRLCKSYIDTYGMDICILRNFNTFGPWQNDGGDGSTYGAVIGIFTRAALRNEPIRIFGDGEQRRDYMYITDAIKGYELGAKYTGVLNIGSGTTISINDLAQKIKTITCSQSPILHVESRPGEVQRLCADITKAKGFGFAPETDLDKHLKEFITHYENHLRNL